MKLLVLAQNYPYASQPTAAAFNERSVVSLQPMCKSVEVLVPRPYVPPVLASLVPRWNAYASIPKYEKRERIPVYRPAYPVFPRVGGAFWVDQAAFWWCRRVAMRMHKRVRFDAMLAFDVVGVGGVAWRTSRLLGIPAAGWVTSKTPMPSFGKAVARALKNLDIVFYQSRELLEDAARLLGVDVQMLPGDRHMVLARGVLAPPSLPKETIRERLRREWGVPDNHTVVLSIGRITREKGVFELVQAIKLATAHNPRITCVLVGANPAFDDTSALQKTLDEMPGIRHHIVVQPACAPEQVWEYLCGADIFAFSSRHEGMPNALLEAMAMGVPSVACAIPPVIEIEAGTGALLLVPPRDVAGFAEALARLTVAPADRLRLGVIGKRQALERFMVDRNSAIAFDRLAKLVARKRHGYGRSPWSPPAQSRQLS